MLNPADNNKLIDVFSNIVTESHELESKLSNYYENRNLFNKLFSDIKNNVEDIALHRLHEVSKIDFSSSSNQLLINQLHGIIDVFKNCHSQGIYIDSAKEIINYLQTIDKEISKTELTQMTTDYFVYKSHLRGKARILFEKFTRSLLRSLKQKISNAIFAGAGSYAKKKSLENKIQLLEPRLSATLLLIEQNSNQVQGLYAKLRACSEPEQEEQIKM